MTEPLLLHLAPYTMSSMMHSQAIYSALILLESQGAVQESNDKSERYLHFVTALLEMESLGYSCESQDNPKRGVQETRQK